jgi:hypothetical protein
MFFPPEILQKIIDSQNKQKQLNKILEKEQKEIN